MNFFIQRFPVMCSVFFSEKSGNDVTERHLPCEEAMEFVRQMNMVQESSSSRYFSITIECFRKTWWEKANTHIRLQEKMILHTPSDFERILACTANKKGCEEIRSCVEASSRFFHSETVPSHQDGWEQTPGD